jgi:ubiquinone/menaquinone biosynthesis C-methylase UbiE
MNRHRRALALAAALALGASACAGLKRLSYEGGDRDEWQQPEAVIALLGIGPGDRVADLGAGSGYFAFRLAEAVGPSGRVYAVDVDDDMLDYLAEKSRERGVANLTVVKAELDDPKLPDGEIDLVFVSDTYHHIEGRPTYFGRLLADLAPNGRIAIVEYDDRSGFAATMGHFTPPEAIEREMREAGYERIAAYDLLERQSFQIFRADDGTGE